MKFYLIFLVFFPSFILAAKKHFHIEHAVDCPESENLPIHTYVEVNNTANVPNKIFFSGYLEIKEKVLGPLEFNYEVNRCDLKAEKCEKFTAMKLQGICKFINSKNGMLADLLHAFNPRLQCPMLPGKYMIEDSSVDVANFAILPIDGYNWVTTLRGTSGEGKNRKSVMCLRIDASITQSKELRRG